MVNNLAGELHELFTSHTECDGPIPLNAADGLFAIARGLNRIAKVLEDCAEFGLPLKLYLDEDIMKYGIPLAQAKEDP